MMMEWYAYVIVGLVVLLACSYVDIRERDERISRMVREKDETY